MASSSSMRGAGLAIVIALVGVVGMSGPVAAADPSASPSPSTTPSPTPAPTASASPAPTPSPTSSPSPSATPSPTPAPTASASPTPTPMASPTPTASDAPASPTPSPTPTPGDTTGTTTTQPTASVLSAAAIRRQRTQARRAKIVRVAKRQRHDRYRRGAVGPNAFDCSGLVRFSYRRARVSRFLGGGHSARAMLAWGRRHHRTGRHHPKIGDVVIYGNGTHAAIYIGKGRVISALNPRQGIRITRLHALSARFTAFIHTRL